MTREEEISYAFVDLYPTGRAWNYVRNNNDETEETASYTDGTGVDFTDGTDDVFDVTYDIFEKKSKQLQYAYERAFVRTNEKLARVLDQLLPDNEGFNYDDVVNWERNLGIDNSDLLLDERKEVIYARLGYTNNNPYRQTGEYLQEQLQANGFDLYVHENRFWNGTTHEAINPFASLYGKIKYGQALYGTQGVTYNQVVRNYVDKTIDGANVNFNNDRLAYIFFVGGPTFGDIATVNNTREDELRDLILTLKPLHSVAVLQINLV